MCEVNEVYVQKQVKKSIKDLILMRRKMDGKPLKEREQTRRQLASKLRAQIPKFARIAQDAFDHVSPKTSRV